MDKFAKQVDFSTPIEIHTFFLWISESDLEVFRLGISDLVMDLHCFASILLCYTYSQGEYCLCEHRGVVTKIFGHLDLHTLGFCRKKCVDFIGVEKSTHLAHSSICYSGFKVGFGIRILV